MNTSRKIQIALGTIFLWSSTAVSGFAATNINPEKNQSNTVNLPVESIPSSPLNLTQDTHLLIAQNHGDMISRLAWQIDENRYIPGWEEALKQPDSQKIILEFCPAQPQDKVEDCWRVLDLWSAGKMMQIFESQDLDFDLLRKIRDISNAARDAY